MLEQWSEGGRPSVNLVGLKYQVVRRDFLVQRNVARRGSRTGTEPIGYVGTPQVAEKVEAEINEGEPFELGLTQLGKGLSLSLDEGAVI